MNDESSSATVSSRRSRWKTRVCISAAIAGVTILIAPWLIANSPLRDRLINRLIGMPHLTASSQEASFGWLSPLSVEKLELDGDLDRFQVDVGSVAAEQSWPSLLSNPQDLGTISIVEPHIQLNLPLGEAGQRAISLTPSFTAAIKDAACTVRFNNREVPILDVRGMDLTLNVEGSQGQQILTLEPTELFSATPLTPERCNELLHLMSPSLRDAADVDGQFSLKIDRLMIPLGVPDDRLAREIEIEGELTLHQVSLQTESRLLQAIAKLMADLHGKSPPTRTRVVKDATVRFHVRDGRLFHEGLKVGFPDIAPNLQMTSRGSIGIDETLDFHLEVPRLDKVKQAEHGPVRCHVTGTLHNPILSISDASLVVRVPERSQPLIDVDGIDFTVRVEDTDAGRVASVDPVQILSRKALNEQLAMSLFQLVDPGIKYSPLLTGELSMSVDRLRIPLNRPDARWQDDLEFHGLISIHQVSSRINTPLRQAIAKMIADMYDREPTDIVRVTQDTEIEFEFRKNRLHFDGLEAGFPDIDPSLQIRSRGSVGLDETLDLFIEVPRLDTAKRQQHGPVQCHITGTVSQPELSVKNASLVVHLPNRSVPLIDVDGVDLKAKVETTPAGRFLAFEPAEILRRGTVTRRLASGLLQLVDPQIRYAPEMTGSVSLAVDKLRIPLDATGDAWLQGLEVHGNVVIHEATSIAETPARRAMIKLLSDLYGVEPPSTNRVTHNTDIDFELRRGRVHYEGLQFGFPDIDPGLVVSSQGSIGLDKTLDVHLELPRVDKQKMQERGPVQCHLTGSVESPHLSVKDASLVIRINEEDEPLLDLDGVDMEMEVEFVEERPVLTVAPMQVFSQQTLGTALGDRLLSLVAPTLSDVADVEGEASLSLQSLQVPLAAASRDQLIADMRMVGQLQLHEIRTSVETPLLTAMVKVLADIYGKSPSDVIRVAKNDEIRFEVRDGRLFQEGLKIGFPDISPELMVTMNGSVGIDRSLDLTLEVPATLAKLEGTKSAGGPKTFQYKISGTIDLPIVVEISEGSP